MQARNQIWHRYDVHGWICGEGHPLVHQLCPSLNWLNIGLCRWLAIATLCKSCRRISSSGVISRGYGDTISTPTRAIMSISSTFKLERSSARCGTVIPLQTAAHTTRIRHTHHTVSPCRAWELFGRRGVGGTEVPCAAQTITGRG